MWPNGTIGLDLLRRALAVGCVFLLSHSVPNVRVVAAHDTIMDVGSLDRRTSAALRLFERQDATAGEAELREMAEQYPSYAPPSFYLGLLSQGRQEDEMSIRYYAAALHAGMLQIFCLFLWRLIGRVAIPAATIHE